jgi:hypothetical protein
VKFVSKLKIQHNMSDIQLEEALEKALKGLKPYAEPKRTIPDALADKIKDEHDEMFDRILYNMMSEIQTVINQN